MAKITLQQIQNQLSENNWSLISEEYCNLDSEIIVKCPEGHTVYTSWGKLRKKYECPQCKQNKYTHNKQIILKKKANENRILALDQATHITGWSIFDGTELTRYGIYEAEGEEEAQRFHKIKEWLISMIENWQPDMIGIEGIQYQSDIGVTTFQTLARLQGILIDLCYELKIPCKICHTKTWKAHCGVKGRSRSDQKKSMQNLVKNWFDISVEEDEADAIGIGKYVAENFLKRTEIVDWE